MFEIPVGDFLAKNLCLSFFFHINNYVSGVIGGLKLTPRNTLIKFSGGRAFVQWGFNPPNTALAVGPGNGGPWEWGTLGMAGQYQNAWPGPARQNFGPAWPGPFRCMQILAGPGLLNKKPARPGLMLYLSIS